MESTTARRRVKAGDLALVVHCTMEPEFVGRFVEVLFHSPGGEIEFAGFEWVIDEDGAWFVRSMDGSPFYDDGCMFAAFAEHCLLPVTDGNGDVATSALRDANLNLMCEA